MNILEALEPTGKAVRKHHQNYFIELKGRELFDNDNQHIYLSPESFHADDWRPYHEKPEIRPGKAGELWVYSGEERYSARYYHTKLSTEKEVVVVGDNGICGQIEGMIHNQNGWERLRPSVPDENVDKVVIEGVTWDSALAVEFPRIFEQQGYTFRRFLDKPPMKMTLEWEKEVPDE